VKKIYSTYSHHRENYYKSLDRKNKSSVPIDMEELASITSRWSATPEDYEATAKTVKKVVKNELVLVAPMDWGGLVGYEAIKPYFNAHKIHHLTLTLYQLPYVIDKEYRPTVADMSGVYDTGVKSILVMDSRARSHYSIVGGVYWALTEGRKIPTVSKIYSMLIEDHLGFAQFVCVPKYDTYLGPIKYMRTYTPTLFKRIIKKLGKEELTSLIEEKLQTPFSLEELFRKRITKLRTSLFLNRLSKFNLSKG